MKLRVVNVYVCCVCMCVNSKIINSCKSSYSFLKEYSVCNEHIILILQGWQSSLWHSVDGFVLCQLSCVKYVSSTSLSCIVLSQHWPQKESARGLEGRSKTAADTQKVDVKLVQFWLPCIAMIGWLALLVWGSRCAHSSCSPQKTSSGSWILGQVCVPLQGEVYWFYSQ